MAEFASRAAHLESVAGESHDHKWTYSVLEVTPLFSEDSLLGVAGVTVSVCGRAGRTMCLQWNCEGCAVYQAACLISYLIDISHHEPYATHVHAVG